MKYFIALLVYFPAMAEKKQEKITPLKTKEQIVDFCIKVLNNGRQLSVSFDEPEKFYKYNGFWRFLHDKYYYGTRNITKGGPGDYYAMSGRYNEKDRKQILGGCALEVYKEAKAKEEDKRILREFEPILSKVQFLNNENKRKPAKNRK